MSKVISEIFITKEEPTFKVKPGDNDWTNRYHGSVSSLRTAVECRAVALPASGVVLRSARLSTIAQQPVYFRFTCNETALVAEGGDAVVGGGGADIVAEEGADVVAGEGPDVVAEGGDAVVAGGEPDVVAGEGGAVVGEAASNKEIQRKPDRIERFGGPFCVHC